MKNKLIKATKALLTTCMALAIIVGPNFTSLIFFGEYEYPTPSTK